MEEQGYIKLNGKPTFVTVIRTCYCHGQPVARIVTDGRDIWETHEPIYPDESYLCGDWWVPMSN